MTRQSEKALDNLTKCNADLRADIEHWHQQKDQELCQMMTQTADNYINYHQKVYAIMYIGGEFVLLCNGYFSFNPC